MNYNMPFERRKKRNEENRSAEKKARTKNKNRFVWMKNRDDIWCNGKYLDRALKSHWIPVFYFNSFIKRMQSTCTEKYRCDQSTTIAANTKHRTKLYLLCIAGRKTIMIIIGGFFSLLKNCAQIADQFNQRFHSFVTPVNTHPPPPVCVQANTQNRMEHFYFSGIPHAHTHISMDEESAKGGARARNKYPSNLKLCKNNLFPVSFPRSVCASHSTM